MTVHERDRLDLLVTGGEMPVPEQGEFLAERVRSVEDAVEPADLEQVEVRRAPRRLAQAIDRLDIFSGELWRVEQPRDARLGTGCDVTEQFRAGRAKAGATV